MIVCNTANLSSVTIYYPILGLNLSCVLDRNKYRLICYNGNYGTDIVNHGSCKFIEFP
ncbi:hypothetical protein Ahy_B05g074703 isoform E [Arachis hypogaea]|uniref:Uncharacterized protein n=1 Tax=Arachis hypogaea TaxID=3818 RepID=A0A444YZM2_ARAHY|nr:hypothetical protein Ahy_B05g074703 isoform E [Arachis hypogaea]